jgi:uncharacterized protein (DUF433 family)
MTTDSSPKQPLTVRVRPATIDQLQRRCRELGATQTSLVERYLEEGMRMDEHPLLYFREGAAGRRPALTGTRVDVWQVIETLGQNANEIESTAEYLGIAAERVRACVGYYADYGGEIDEWIERARAIAEREEARWRREQELLA